MKKTIEIFMIRAIRMAKIGNQIIDSIVADPLSSFQNSFSMLLAVSDLSGLAVEGFCMYQSFGRQNCIAFSKDRNFMAQLWSN